MKLLHGTKTTRKLMEDKERDELESFRDGGASYLPLE